MKTNSNGNILNASGKTVVQTLTAFTVNDSSSSSFDFIVKGGTDSNLFFVNTSTDRIGIGTNTPNRKLEVNGGYNLIHNPNTELTASVQGYGDIVTFGTGTLTAGLVYYLNSSNAWVQAANTSTLESTGLLAVALGTSPSDGMLVRGYVRYASFPNVSIGGKLYLSTAGTLTGTIPSGSFVRLIGYSVDQTNRRIHFNPSNDWIEL